MNTRELSHIIGAILILFVVSAFAFIIKGEALAVLQVFVFSFIVIGINVLVKKGMAYALDASAEHRIWHVYRFGVREKEHFKKEMPFGAILPIVLSVLSLGFVKMMAILTYETRALKHRAAKRFGFYSFTEMTDWHNGLIGATGIIILFIIGIIGYLFDFTYLFKISVYYAFWNMLPISDLDGTQIFFGSRVLWTVLAVITLIFTFYAFVL